MAVTGQESLHNPNDFAESPRRTIDRIYDDRDSFLSTLGYPPNLWQSC
jgi:hypothetical protein